MTITHVRYREGQTLRAADLIAEQAGREDGWRRHTLAQHRWGIASGLQLVHEDQKLRSAESIVVAPGVAIDGWGRTLVLTTEQVIPLARFTHVTSGTGDSVAFWLRPTIKTSDRNCEPARGDRLEGCVSLSRLDHGDKPAVAGWPDWLEPSYLPLPKPVPLWPVYLGRLELDNGSWRLHSPDVDIPYVEPVGSMIRSPRGDVEVQLVGEGADDQGRFVIRTTDREGESTDRIVVEPGGRVRLQGPVEIEQSADSRAGAGVTSDLLIDGSAAGNARALKLMRPVVLPKVARPWQIYRTAVPVNERPAGRLRVELPDPGKQGNGSAIRLAVGHTKDAPDDGCDFEPCLTVGADCALHITGQLTVTGRIIQAPVQPDIDDPRFADALVKAQIKGLLDAMLSFSEVGLSGLKVEVALAPDPPNSMTELGYVVTVKATDDAVVDDVIVYARLTVNGHSQPTQQASPADLTSGVFTGTFPAPVSGGTATIAVSALGLQAGGVPVFGRAIKKDVKIT